MFPSTGTFGIEVLSPRQTLSRIAEWRKGKTK